MTTPEHDDIDVPAFDPAIARRAVRRGTWSLTARVVAIGLALLLAMTALAVVRTARNRATGDFLAGTAIAAWRAAHPHLEFSYNGSAHVDQNGAELRGTYRELGPSGIADAGLPVPYTLRATRPRHVSFPSVDASSLAHASVADLPAKADTLALIDRLPQASFLLSLELESALSQDDATAFRQPYLICSKTYDGLGPLGYPTIQDDMTDRADDCQGGPGPELLGTYLAPRTLKERTALFGPEPGNDRLAWPDPVLRTFTRWAATLKPSDNKGLLRSVPFPRVEALQRIAKQPRAYGFALTAVTSDQARKLLADPRVRGIVLADASIDVRLQGTRPR